MNIIAVIKMRKVVGLLVILIVISLSGCVGERAPPAPEMKDIKKFSTEEEFKAYLQKAAELEYGGWGFGIGIASAVTEAMTPPPATAAPSPAGKVAIPERVSETTVQVPGIDEPDIVKTDGKKIYLSQSYYARIMQESIPGRKVVPAYQEAETRIISAFPPAELAVEASVERSGNILLDKNTLVIFSGQEIHGYDISNPKSPEKKWDIKLEGSNFLVGARLYKNKIYLVTRNAIDRAHPCPIKPLSAGGTPLTVGCPEIYYPAAPVPVDATFTALIIDPSSGKVGQKVSFVGSSGSSIVYMSENAIYVTYSYYESFVKFFSNFLKENRDAFPGWLIERMEKLESYDISQRAKLMELQIILDNYLNSLSDDERMKMQNELSNRMNDYYRKHRRELEKTGIVKIRLDGLEVAASGSVPGYPLNQFALDEYREHLRVATTVGQVRGFVLAIGSAESACDVYVLDRDLKVQGSVKDLGLTERIYSVRFIEDKGYVVTFRQVDPFYVLDLSDPRKPELKGELKIPGYSSYLQPIGKDKILGIGKENWQVKISLFDVSSPKEPKELHKYILDESWSDVLSTHHAFLLDRKHEIFFLPGSRGGYVFSYKNDRLELVKALSGISSRRAIYIDDYLYVIGDDRILVLNEITWEKIGELEWGR